MGLEKMIQLQCEALVVKFKVSPLICGVASTIWLWFIANTEVFNDGSADTIIQDSESQKSGEPEKPPSNFKHRAEHHNIYGQQAVIVSFKNLRRRKPLSCSLAIYFLACRNFLFWLLIWTLKNKKEFALSSWTCLISSRVMFMPPQSVSAQKLESFAASIAQAIGLHLPSVNFLGIAS
ncbi:TATA box-binding protein-associated factor RNA polymerase I subunit B-like [Tripterygium wilfordii]|uniref:TATA box-binding protein-associated factor RNA polymerase I subunit B-like n=1 Tax=Tripterygium wilfordii TaxID=458696 RepID=UPI0018F7EEE6|nr:TATA box-binding protein-associated factor RNA polymerase I subunit B-like [Tripterygium wilfordii]